MTGEVPSYLTIVARGNHGGYMQHGDHEGKAIYTRDELLDRIRISLGGRAAEIVYYGDRDGISTGASGDLSSATTLAEQLICAYGMDSTVGLGVIDKKLMYSDAVAKVVHEAVNNILKTELELAVELINRNRSRIDRLVDALMVKNHMNGEEIDQILRES